MNTCTTYHGFEVLNITQMKTRKNYQNIDNIYESGCRFSMI